MIRAQAQQIAYAVLRLAPYVRRKELRHRLEESALDCFAAACLEDGFRVARQAEALLGLIKLGMSLYEVEILNGDMLVGALKDLAVSADVSDVSDESEEAPDAAVFLDDASRLFHEDGDIHKKSVKDLITDQAAAIKQSRRDGSATDRQSIGNDRQSVAERSATDRQSIGNGIVLSGELPNDRQSIGNQSRQDVPLDAVDSDLSDENEDSIGGMVSIGNAIRQASIIEKIRSMSVKNALGDIIGCRMKDLLSAFPMVSERTLRNDLQRLVNHDKVQRHGAGGFSVYVIK